MPTCAYPNQGYNYGTHEKKGCASYSQCALCQMCKNYDQHNYDCRRCESRKSQSGAGTRKPVNIHRCSNAQLEAHRMLVEHLKTPLFDIGAGIQIPEEGIDMVEDPRMKPMGEALSSAFGEHAVVEAYEED